MSKPLESLFLDQQAVMVSEERFRALVTATADSIYRISADWSDMLQLDGRGLLSDINAPIADWMQKYIHPHDQELVKAAIQKAIQTKKILQVEHRVLLADGSLGWTLWRAVNLYEW